MNRFITLVLIAAGLFGATEVQAEDWLLQESPEVAVYAVYPLRNDSGRVADVRFQQLDLRDRQGKPVTDFGFSLRVDSETFNFNSSRIARFYLRPWNQYWTRTGHRSAFPCSKNYFAARVEGEEESVGRWFDGYQNHYPKGIWYRASYVQEISVLGESRVRTEYRPIEIWGFANGEANARRMADFYKERIRDSVFYSFSSSYQDGHNFSFAGQKLDDKVEGHIARRYEETRDTGRPFQRRTQIGNEHVTVRVNGRSRNYSVELRGFSSPGRKELTIDGRRVYLDLKVAETSRMLSKIWVQFLPSGEPPPLADLDLFISKCDR